eukprot:SAG11_NODE_1731_length_4363_cov_4.183865_4_plen_65_part_00
MEHRSNMLLNPSFRTKLHELVASDGLCDATQSAVCDYSVYVPRNRIPPPISMSHCPVSLHGRMD